MNRKSRPGWLALGTLAVLGSSSGCTTSRLSSPIDPPDPPGAQVTGVTLTPSSPSVAVGQSQFLVATASYSDGTSKVVTSQAAWSSSPPGIAIVNGGLVSGVTEGSTVVTATFGGEAGSSQISVVPAPPSNEPAGFTTFTEHFFNTIPNTDGAGVGRWSNNPNNPNLGIVSDPVAPRSAPNVMQWTFPAGFHAGSSPGSIEFDDLQGATQLYLSFYMKLSDNFQGEGSQTNKVGFVWLDGEPAVFFSNEGSGTTNPLIPTIRYQGNGDSREYFRQNVGTRQAMTRGVWRRWEVVLIANTGGQSNGVIRWWIDGQQVGEYTDVEFRSANQPFQYMFLQPIWGGVGGTVAATQYMWMDHLYISGHS